jgi:predicted nucleotidyltransferase
VGEALRGGPGQFGKGGAGGALRFFRRIKRYLPSSDIDLLIVVREAPENPLERIPAYIDPKMPLDLEPRVFTVEEFFRVARERRRFAQEVLTKGILLAGRKEILEEARRIAGLQSFCS